MAAPDARPAPRSIGAYVSELKRWRFPPEGDLQGDADPQHYDGWRRVVIRAFPEKLINQGRIAATRAAMLARRGRSPSPDGPTRLHLGCGERRIPGWINVDLAGAAADLVWDLRRPLPFDEGSVDAIFHEHFLEHLPMEDALASLRTCHGLLAPGGVLRIGVPDFREHFRSYVEEDGFLERIRPGRPAALLTLNELVYSYGHASLWDLETFELALGEVGFDRVEARPFGESLIEPAPDSPERRLGTLYVEAVKPR